MPKPAKAPVTVDAYIRGFPLPVRRALKEMRRAIKEAAPEAEEKISYRMPAFAQNGILVWFAAFTNHIGYYPKTSAIKAFAKELSGYETSKGAIRLPLDEKLPLALVKRIVKYRVKENAARAKARGMSA